MCTLDTLIFLNNSLNSVKQKFMDLLLSSFRNNYRIAVLRFSFNQIANHTASRIFSAAAACYALRIMNLSDNIIGDSGLETIATLLEESKNLTTLNLENNRVSDVGVRHICQGWCRLRMCAPHFAPRAEELEIHFKEFWRLLLVLTCCLYLFKSGLVCNMSIKELNLNRNRLRDQSLHYLRASLVEADKEVLMRALDVDPEVSYKSKWKANRSLDTLRVSHNYLADAAARSVSRIFWENTAVTTFDLSANQIGEPGARAMAHGVLQRSQFELSVPQANGVSPATLVLSGEIKTTGRRALQVALSRNRFGDAGAKAIQDAVKATGSVHDFRMEGVRPGFGLVEDAAREPLEPTEPEFEFLDVRSRPATVRRSNRSSQLPTRASSQRKPGSRHSQKLGVGTPRPRTVRILESPLPLYVDTMHPLGIQTDRPVNTGSDVLLPEISRPRTVRFFEPEDAPSEDARAPTSKSSRGGSKSSRKALRASWPLTETENVRLRTTERASLWLAWRGRGGEEKGEASVGGYGSESSHSRATGAASGLIQNEPSFVAACARLEIPADISKPPKTGGGRRKQQRIYEVRVHAPSSPIPIHVWGKISVVTDSLPDPPRSAPPSLVHEPVDTSAI